MAIPSKIAKKISTVVCFVPSLTRFPWNWVSAHGVNKTRMMWLPDGLKSFKIGLAALIQYRHVTSSQPRRRSKYALRISASRSKQEAQLVLTNPRDAFRGQSRSPTIVTFHTLGIVSSSAIVTLSLRRASFPIFDFKNCRDLEIRVRGHSKYHAIDCV